MKRFVLPGERSGSLRICASKSQAHRLLICAALSEDETLLHCDGLSQDIQASIRCLCALGAEIQAEGDRLQVRPIRRIPEGEAALYCRESGSTLRFLLPVAGALGAAGRFHREGRLAERPLAPLDRALREKGVSIWEEGEQLCFRGALQPGAYSLPGDVSSQYISGLLMALPRLPGESSLTVTGELESAGYVAMTEQALRLSGLRFARQGNSYRIPGGQTGRLPAELFVEGDYSNAAFFLAVGALSSAGVTVRGLDPASAQGDREILTILRRMGAVVEQEGDAVTVRRGRLKALEIDAAPIPDLVPVLSVLAALAEGETHIRRAGRLRLKESDRLRSTAAMLEALGGQVEELPDGLVIQGRERLDGGTTDAWGDHRIAMAAAVAACGCRGAVTVVGAQAVDKSYPRFWADFDSLTGGRA